MKTKAIILDDEISSIETLSWKLAHYCPEVEVVATFEDPLEAIEHLRQSPPDLLFLDIEMPMLNGFDVLDELGSQLTFEVIFITAYDQFGIQAVRSSALDYLLKPVQNKELQEAIERYHTRQATMGSKGKIPGLLQNIEAMRSGRQPKIALATKESIEFVDPDDIILCTSDSNYTMVYLQDGRKKLLSKTLKDIEQMLLPHQFFRPHHSHLINLNRVKKIIRGDGGYLVMTNKMEVPISKNRRDQLLRLLT